MTISPKWVKYGCFMYILGCFWSKKKLNSSENRNNHRPKGTAAHVDCDDNDDLIIIMHEQSKLDIASSKVNRIMNVDDMCS